MNILLIDHDRDWWVDTTSIKIIMIIKIMILSKDLLSVRQ